MAKLLKHLGLNYEKHSQNSDRNISNSNLNVGRYRKVDSIPERRIGVSRPSDVSNVNSIGYDDLSFHSEALSANKTIDEAHNNRLSDENAIILNLNRNSVLSEDNIQSTCQVTEMAATMKPVSSSKVVLLEDYSDPVDVIKSFIAPEENQQTDIYSNPTDCQSGESTSANPDEEDIYAVPPDDDYTDPYESTSGLLPPDNINCLTEDEPEEDPVADDSDESADALRAFSFLDDANDNYDSSSVVYEVPPDSDSARIYDTPAVDSNATSLVYDMPWEWTSGANIKATLHTFSDRSSLSSHGSSGSQNSVGSGGSSSSGAGRRRHIYETAFDSVVVPNKADEMDRKIQGQTVDSSKFSTFKSQAKHSNKVLVDIAPKDKRMVMLVKNRNDDFTTHRVQAHIECHSLDGRSSNKSNRKFKNYSFSDFDRIRKTSALVGDEMSKPRVTSSHDNCDIKQELKGIGHVMIGTTLQEINSNRPTKSLPADSDLPHIGPVDDTRPYEEYEKPWEFKLPKNLQSVISENDNLNCDNFETSNVECKSEAVSVDKHPTGPDDDARPDDQYEKPWDFHATQSQFELISKNSLNRSSSLSQGKMLSDVSRLPDSNVTSGEEAANNVQSASPSEYIKSATSSLPNDGVPENTPNENVAQTELSSSLETAMDFSHTGAVPKISKDPVAPLSKPKLMLDFSQSSRRQKQNLNLNFGCAAMSVIGEKIDLNIPLEQQGWYHGSISRLDAENLLRALKEGSYLVRNSESCKQDFSLSLKSAKGFMHMKIVNKNDKFILGQFSKPFDNIPQMIQHYAVNKLPIRGAEHMSLLYPVIDQLL